MHEFFEHTADLGIRIRAESFPALLTEAGQALFELIVVNFEEVKPDKRHVVHLEQSAKELLLFDWLNELLYLYETKHFLGREFQVTYHQGILDAVILGEPQDDDRHQLDHEVKAITYHQLIVEQQGDGSWLAEVIVDI